MNSLMIININRETPNRDRRQRETIKTEKQKKMETERELHRDQRETEADRRRQC